MIKFKYLFGGILLLFLFVGFGIFIFLKSSDNNSVINSQLDNFCNQFANKQNKITCITAKAISNKDNSPKDPPQDKDKSQDKDKDKSPQDKPQQDKPPQDKPPRDKPPQDKPTQDKPPRDKSPKDKDAQSRDSSAKSRKKPLLQDENDQEFNALEDDMIRELGEDVLNEESPNEPLNEESPNEEPLNEDQNEDSAKDEDIEPEEEETAMEYITKFKITYNDFLDICEQLHDHKTYLVVQGDRTLEYYSR